MVIDNTSGSMGIAGLKVGSLNCNGLGKKNKLQKVLTWLKKKQENICYRKRTLLLNQRILGRKFGEGIRYISAMEHQTPQV